MNDFNMKEISDKVIGLYTEYLNSVVNYITWGQELAVDLTKTVMGELNVSQVDYQKIFDGFSAGTKSTQALYQKIWEDGVRTATNSISAFKATSDETLVELERRIGTINEKLTGTAKN